MTKEELKIFEPYIDKKILCIKNKLHRWHDFKNILKGEFHTIRISPTSSSVNGYGVILDECCIIYNIDIFFNHFKLETKEDIRQRKIKSILS